MSEKVKKPFIRISQAGACPRKLQLEAWGVEGLPLWEGLERAFEEGRLHEPSILEWGSQHVPGAPYTLSNQQMEVKATRWLVGHIDALATNANGKICLLEAKCLSHRAFQEFREKGVRESQPQYFVQVQLYLHGLRNAGWAVNEAYLTARDKETPRNRWWDHHYERIVYDAAFVAETINGLNNLVSAIEEHCEIPPPYSPRTSWRCRPPYCPYTYRCWPDWERTKAEIISRDDLTTLVEEYNALGEEIGILETRRGELKDQLLAACGGQPVQAGRWLVQITERSQERFDVRLARKELPAEVLARLLKVSTHRVLEIKEAI